MMLLRKHNDLLELNVSLEDREKQVFDEINFHLLLNQNRYDFLL
jgi:hypothetical protein